MTAMQAADLGLFVSGAMLGIAAAFLTATRTSPRRATVAAFTALGMLAVVTIALAVVTATAPWGTF